MRGAATVRVHERSGDSESTGERERKRRPVGVKTHPLAVDQVGGLLMAEGGSEVTTAGIRPGKQVECCRYFQR